MKSIPQIRLALACAVAMLAVPAIAPAAITAKVDPPHTSATFSVKHLTLSTVSGTIQIKSADIAVGDDNMLTSADAVLDLTTIDTHAGQRDNDLKSDHWFDVSKYPEMTFKSTKIDPGTAGTMTIAGDLTFHGVTKPIALAGKFEGTVKDGRGRTHAGYTATGTIDRTQWGIGATFPPVIVGNDVTITIEVEAIES